MVMNCPMCLTLERVIQFALSLARAPKIIGENT